MMTANRQVTLLKNETSVIYHIDIDQLEENSDAIVMVECNTCKERFTRHYNMLSQLHHCLGSQRTTDQSDQPIRLEYMLLTDTAHVPTRSRSTDAGYDIRSSERVELEPQEIRNIATGLVVVAPAGYYLTIDGRSSLWSKKKIAFRGIVDGTFTGELIVAMQNCSDKLYQIEEDNRIAQIVAHKIVHCDFTKVAKISPAYSTRGNAGFGSSGR